MALSHLDQNIAKSSRKCLHCGLGQGDDLEDPLLRQSFYQEVICELEELETGLSKIFRDDWQGSKSFHCSYHGSRFV